MICEVAKVKVLRLGVESLTSRQKHQLTPCEVRLLYGHESESALESPDMSLSHPVSAKFHDDRSPGDIPPLT
jgi:hypothetical protein